MSTSTSHPTFPSRPYSGALGKLPDRSNAAGGSNPFGASSSARETARLERERIERERAERERAEREGQNRLAELTEEQREEINEAVSFVFSVCFVEWWCRVAGLIQKGN